MGSRSSTSLDFASRIVLGEFGAENDATGNSTEDDAPEFNGLFNFALWGDDFVGTVQLQRSFDGGTVWVPVSKNTDGDPAEFTAPATLILEEPERGVLYRAICTAYSDGTGYARFSQ